MDYEKYLIPDDLLQGIFPPWEPRAKVFWSVCHHLQCVFDLMENTLTTSSCVDSKGFGSGHHNWKFQTTHNWVFISIHLAIQIYLDAWKPQNILEETFLCARCCFGAKTLMPKASLQKNVLKTKSCWNFELFYHAHNNAFIEIISSYY